ncbi:MAG: hypothetical protein MSG64_17565 [Pyrinomonadaceae bacterium MAG19_C2-C3]|nr:hypothetical protein [Pyrinomonadaceae bacterium MAG19_C2-C3]
MPRATQTLILCGDCSGNENSPRYTLMTLNQTCERCGGRAFVLAAPIIHERNRAFRATQNNPNFEKERP